MQISIAKSFEPDQYARQLDDNNVDRVSGLVLVGGWRWGLDAQLGALYTSSVLDRLRLDIILLFILHIYVYHISSFVCVYVYVYVYVYACSKDP